MIINCESPRIFANIIQAKAISANALQQRLTALDRSNEDFSIQITEAFNILDINPDDTLATWSSDDAGKQHSIGSGPKEEWFVRWLLKRLSVEEVQEKRYKKTSFSRWHRNSPTDDLTGV